VHKLLTGYRNLPAANMEQLEEVLIRLAQLVTDFSEINELDINPAFINEEGKIVAVDARILLKESDKKPPYHLVISPYPNEYEEEVITEDDVELFVRPIRPEDEPLLKDLFESLSPQSIYYRFFSPMKSFPHSMLARFTQIDYDREIAMVAIHHEENSEKMLGVSRIMLELNQVDAEFSIVVRDEWHGKGIGAALLKRCLEIAAKQGIQKVWGYVMSDNTRMLALGRKLGFEVKRISGENDYELTIHLDEEFKKKIS
jgi:acetyltransferase